MLLHIHMHVWEECHGHVKQAHAMGTKGSRACVVIVFDIDKQEGEEWLVGIVAHATCSEHISEGARGSCRLLQHVFLFLHFHVCFCSSFLPSSFLSSFVFLLFLFLPSSFPSSAF